MKSEQRLSVPPLKPERDYVSRYGDLPSPTSSLYTSTTVNKNADGSFNHVVSGMSLVFDKLDSGSDSLFRRYCGAGEKYVAKADGKVRNLTICGDEVVIAGELWLPETDVLIFARRLAFKDRDGSVACIRTTPLPHVPDKALDGKDGADGVAAGKISVFAAEFDAGDSKTTRFRLRGGKAQAAGEGKDGQDGSHFVENKDFVRSLSWQGNHFAFDPPAVQYDAYYRSAYVVGGDLVESNDDKHFAAVGGWPTSGKDADKPGKPGSGGAGGAFLAALPLWSVRSLVLQVLHEQAAAANDSFVAARAKLVALLGEVQRFDSLPDAEKQRLASAFAPAATELKHVEESLTVLQTSAERAQSPIFVLCTEAKAAVSC